MLQVLPVFILVCQWLFPSHRPRIPGQLARITDHIPMLEPPVARCTAWSHVQQSNLYTTLLNWLVSKVTWHLVRKEWECVAMHIPAPYSMSSTPWLRHCPLGCPQLDFKKRVTVIQCWDGHLQLIPQPRLLNHPTLPHNMTPAINWSTKILLHLGNGSPEIQDPIASTLHFNGSTLLSLRCHCLHVSNSSPSHYLKGVFTTDLGNACPGMWLNIAVYVQQNL